MEIIKANLCGICYKSKELVELKYIDTVWEGHPDDVSRNIVKVYKCPKCEKKYNESI